MKRDVIIRDATENDLAAIDNILIEANLEFKPGISPDIWRNWQENMRASARFKKGGVIVIELNKEIVGIVQFFPDSTFSTLDHWPKGSACIRLMGVLPEYRKRGFGKMLALECIKRASKLKVSAIYLQTGTVMHAAQKLYKKLGFKIDPKFRENPFGTYDCTVAYRYDLC